MAEKLWAAVPDPAHSRFIFKKELQALQATACRSQRLGSGGECDRGCSHPVGPEGMGGALGPCTGLRALKAGLDSHSRS